jgi:S1-C subfamily serine protease
MSLNRTHLIVLVAFASLVLASLACSTTDLGTQPQPADSGSSLITDVPPSPPPQNDLTPTPTAEPGVVQIDPTPVPVLPGLDPVAEEQLYIDLYRRVNQAVVSIRILQSNGVEVALGSGFVIDLEGHIVTNNHVVEGGDQYEIDFANGQKVRGTLLGTDSAADLAVLKVEVPADQLVAVTLGDSDAIQVGQRVVAIGNPFGLSGTMTIGIVSGLGRVLPTDVSAPGGGSFSAPDIIQTDAAINPGNSGGPLLNLSGEVIGVNQSIRSETGANSGISFSIASNTVKRVVAALIETGTFEYPYLGISSSSGDLSLPQIEALNLPQATGAYITEVSPGGPADVAGLRGDSALNPGDLTGGGDLIVAIDGQPVVNFADVLSYLVNHGSVGQTVTLSVIRDGTQQDFPVVLGKRP